MFVVEGERSDTVLLHCGNAMHREPGFGFNVQNHAMAGFTVLFCNFAEASAGRRWQAQADALRRAKAETMGIDCSRRQDGDVPGSKLRRRYGAGGGGRVLFRRWRDCGRRASVDSRDHGRVGAVIREAGAPFGSDG